MVDFKTRKNKEIFLENYLKARKGDVTASNLIKTTITAFMADPIVEKRKVIQAFGVSTDLAQLTTNSFNVTTQYADYDLGYEKAFKDVTLDDYKLFWEIYDVKNGLTFKKIQEGHRIDIQGFSGTVTQAYVDYYGGAIGWTDKMIRSRSINAMIDMAEIFRNRFWSNKAANHYLLLATAAALNITPYQGAIANGVLSRDVQTVNAAAIAITNRCKDKGYGDMANARLLCFANPADRRRLNGVLLAQSNGTLGVGIGAVGEKLDWNVEFYYTYDANIAIGAPIMILPGNKIQKADAMQPTSFTSPKDPTSLNMLEAVWAIYGAVIADTDQCQQFVLG